MAVQRYSAFPMLVPVGRVRTISAWNPSWSITRVCAAIAPAYDLPTAVEIASSNWGTS